MGDTETFKLALFFIGNGCAPVLFTEWMLLAQYWDESPQKAEKRARQIDFVLNNVDGQKQMVLFRHRLQQTPSSERKTETVNKY